MVARLVVSAAGVVAVFLAVDVEVDVGVDVEVGVGVGVDVGVGVGVGVGLFLLEQSVVAKARFVLVLARRESAWCTVASRSLWAAVIEAAAPVLECDAPEDLVAVLLALALLALVVPVLLLVVPVLAAAPVVPVPLVLVASVPVLLLVVPVALPVAAETWPDSAWLRVSLALATCS